MRDWGVISCCCESTKGQGVGRIMKGLERERSKGLLVSGAVFPGSINQFCSTTEGNNPSVPPNSSSRSHHPLYPSIQLCGSLVIFIHLLIQQVQGWAKEGLQLWVCETVNKTIVIIIICMSFSIKIRLNLLLPTPYCSLTTSRHCPRCLGGVVNNMDIGHWPYVTYRLWVGGTWINKQRLKYAMMSVTIGSSTQETPARAGFSLHLVSCPA